MLLVGVRQATISRLEKGFNAAILSSTLERLAQALGTTPEYLLKGDTKSAANPEREILEIFRELDPKFLEAWIAQGRAWKKKTVKAKQTEPA